MRTPSEAPHRVVYHYGGKLVGRVFGTHAAARSFSATLREGELVLVQLAADPMPKGSPAPRNLVSSRKVRTALCECGSGRRRILADAQCSECSGRNFERENKERGAHAQREQMRGRRSR